MPDELMAVYSRAPIAVARGEGSWLWDIEGDRYLDCVAGIATNALGHAHPVLIAALEQQARKLWHVSNGFRIPGQEELARRLTEACFADIAFFGNSGAEAIECALKTARRFHAAGGSPERVDVLGFSGSFHGRTYAAMNAAGNQTYLDGFGPRLPGFHQLSLDDATGIADAIARSTTAALIVEPVQGEGGARALDGEWLGRVRAQCSRAGVLLIYDEVQSGMGRTGRLFAHQWFEGVEPDIMCVAKALGGGFPVSACLTTAEAARGMNMGAHGSTFGGNPLAMAVALAAFEEIAKPETLAQVRRLAALMRDRLRAAAARFPDIISDVRGKGLLIGLKLVPNNREFMAVAQAEGLLVAGGGQNCIRLLPPLTMTEEEAFEAAVRLERACGRIRGSETAPL